MDYLWMLLATLAAYLVGSLSFAVIVSRLMGLNDPRGYGSKNAGATNVLRSGSKKAAGLTLALDFLKGFLPVALVQWLGPHLGLGDAAVATVAVAAVLGHVFPVFFRFKGGKGVATAAGVVFGVHWALGLCVLVVFAAILYASRWVSLASMLAAFAAPIGYMLGERAIWYTNKPVLFALLIVAFVVVIKHGANVGRLLDGTEPKLGKDAAPAPTKKRK